MFTFNFGGEAATKITQPNADTSTQNTGLAPVTKQIPSKVQTNIEWIKYSSSVYVENEEVIVVNPVKVVDHLKSSGFNQAGVLQADREHSDLIPGVYEGGMKIWECSFDLGSLLVTKNPNIFENKTVLDLGCGSGLLGILALKKGSTAVHFHDYNSEVLSFLSIPNVSLNDECFLDRSQFWCGDWGCYNEADSTKFDLILTSETIYNASNHKKLHDTIKSKLKQGGAAYVAGKSYYFGVGGSMKGFRDVAERENVFNVTLAWVSKEGVKREILLLEHKTDESSDDKAFVQA